MARSAQAHMTEGDFYEFVRGRDEKWELVNGQAVKMAGANQRHQDIAANTLVSLHTQLRGKACRPTAADTGIATMAGNVRYPDIVVDCGGRDDQAMCATTPVLVIEILSPSTKSFDSHRKVGEYKSHPDIRYILLIDTNEASALLHYRDDESWGEQIFGDLGDVITFMEIGASLELSEVYAGIDLKPKLARK